MRAAAAPTANLTSYAHVASLGLTSPSTRTRTASNDEQVESAGAFDVPSASTRGTSVGGTNPAEFVPATASVLARHLRL